MNTDQGRRLVTLHDNAERALANLRNANSMSTDDPRATELLETAGDAYAKANAALFTEQTKVVSPLMAASLADVVRSTAGIESPPAPRPEIFEPGKAVWIKGEDGSCASAGFVAELGENDPVLAEGYVAVRLTTDAKIGGEDIPPDTVVSIPAASLSTDPSEVPGAGETPIDDSGKGQAAPSA